MLSQIEKVKLHKKTVAFDAGPYQTWKPNISLEDFKNIHINDQSKKYLKIAVENDIDQRFAIYGKIMKQKDGPSIWYVRFQPTVSETTSKAKIEALELLFGKGQVIQADAHLPGIVHESTRTIWKLEVAAQIRQLENELNQYQEKKSNEDKIKQIQDQLMATKNFLDFLLTPPHYETGLSATLNTQEEIYKLEFLNRSTMNFTIFNLASDLVKRALYFGKRPLINDKFHGREYTFEFQLARSAPEVIVNNLMLNTQNYLKIMRPNYQVNCILENDNYLRVELGDGFGCYNFYANAWWCNNRNDKEIMTEKLLETIYIAAGLKKEPCGLLWTNETDAEIVARTIDVAKKNSINIDLNKIPKVYLKRASYTTLMFAILKNDYAMVKTLIENGADILRLYSEKNSIHHHNFPKPQNNSEVEKYLMAIHNLKIALKENDGETVSHILKLKLINVAKPIDKEDTVLSIATFSSPKVLGSVVNYFIENKISVDMPGPGGESALQLTLTNNQLENTKILLRAGADVNHQSVNGRCPLYTAIMHNGCLELIKTLFATENKVNVNLIDAETLETPIYRAAYLGRKDIVEFLLNARNVVDEIYLNGSFKFIPLHAAARSGYVEIVKLLINSGKVNLDKQNKKGETPFFAAVKRGHTEVVRLLLNTGKVNLDKPDNREQTPLHVAARKGRTEIVRLLINSKKVALDHRDYWNETPLYGAVKNGYVEIVILLLASEKVNLNNENEHNETLLFAAAKNGHKHIIELLMSVAGDLDLDVNLDKPNIDGKTPLYAASENGHIETAKLLLATRKVTLDKPDIEGKTPLYVAAENGHTGIVRLLINTGKVDLNIQNNDEETPLYAAVKNGNLEIVELFINSGKVDFSKLNARNTNALGFATANGYAQTIKLLLRASEIDISKILFKGETLLFIAAKNGHKNVVKLLINLDKLNLDQVCNNGATSLFVAAQNGHLEIVKLLLDSGGVNPNIAFDTITPFFQAIQNNKLEVAKLFLQYDRVDLDKSDAQGGTPLYFATQEGYIELVKLLLNSNRVNPNKTYNGWTPLLGAIFNKHPHIAKLFIQHDLVDLDKANRLGVTPLYLASQEGYTEIVQLLLNSGKVNPNITYDNYTPLFNAIYNNHLEVAKLFIQYDSVDLDHQNDEGETSLYMAVKEGYSEIVKLLLESGKVNPNKILIDRSTILQIAIQNKTSEIIDMLLNYHATNLNILNKEGISPLAQAILAGQKDTVFAMLKTKRVDINLSSLDKTQPSSLQTAITNGHIEIITNLICSYYEKLFNNMDLIPSSIMLALEKCNNYKAKTTDEVQQHHTEFLVMNLQIEKLINKIMTIFSNNKKEMNKYNNRIICVYETYNNNIDFAVISETLRDIELDIEQTKAAQKKLQMHSLTKKSILLFKAEETSSQNNIDSTEFNGNRQLV